jgi:hypothetical protein
MMAETMRRLQVLRFPRERCQEAAAIGHILCTRSWSLLRFKAGVSGRGTDSQALAGSTYYRSRWKS